MSVGLSLQSLTQEFEQTRERLRVVEDDIKKHTGRRNVPPSANFRHPRDAPPGLRSQLANRLDDGPLRRRSQGGAFSRLGRQLNVHEAQRMGQPSSPQTGPPGPHQGPVLAKEQGRPVGDPHAVGGEGGHGPRGGLKRDRVEREPPEDGELEEAPPRKVGLLSSIGASSLTVKGKSRSELLNEQSGDQKVKARNRRMFGMILGTLKSFEKEEITKRKEQVDKKVEKEQKVEEQKEREKEEAIRLRRELIEEKRDKQIKLRQLQAKMEVVGAFEEFSKRHGYMANFIHTSAKPPLMWLPRSLTPACEESLMRSRAKIEAIVIKEQQRVELELERIEGIQRDSDGEIDGKENTCGSTLPSSVAVVVNNECKETEDSKHNGKADDTSIKEKVITDPGMKNIKIIIENDLAVKKGVNGEDRVHAEVDEDSLEQRDEPMEQQQEESKQEEQLPDRHDQDDHDAESAHEDEFMNRPQEDDREQSAKSDHDVSVSTKEQSDSKSRSKSRSKSKSPTPTPEPSAVVEQQEERPQHVEPDSSSKKHVPKKRSSSFVDEEQGEKSIPAKAVQREPAKRVISPPADVSPPRGRSPIKNRPTTKKKRGRTPSSSSSSSGSYSRSSSTGSSSSSSSSDSPRRAPKKATVSTNEGPGAVGPRKRSRSPLAKRSPPTRQVRRTSSSPRPPGKRRGSSPPPPAVARRSRSPKRRSRSPRRRCPVSPPRRDNSPKRRSVSRRRSPSQRRRRRSSSPGRRSVSGGRRRPNRQRSGSRGLPRRGSPIRRRSRSRSPRRAPRRSRSPRRRR